MRPSAFQKDLYLDYVSFSPSFEHLSFQLTRLYTVYLRRTSGILPLLILSLLLWLEAPALLSFSRTTNVSPSSVFELVTVPG
jgi:hypothetical protein